MGSIFFYLFVLRFYIYIYVYIHKYIQHLHSFSVDRHCSFHVLTIVNNDGMDIGVHVSFQINRGFLVFLWICTQE